MPTSRFDRPLLVGESNPYGSDPSFALYPAPDGCSGHRLCRLVLGMRRADYLREFDRTNLCRGNWSREEAMAAAMSILVERAGTARLVLLGSQVCSAFGVPLVPFTVADGVLLRLPHPSGRCRLWNDGGSFLRARAAVAAFLPHLAHLLGREGGE